MTEILLTIHCATMDTPSLIDAIRTVTRVPLHVRAEIVHGRDFADAQASEQVTATLKRSAIELIEVASAMDSILQAAGEAKRRSAVRWHQTAVLARGRMA
ncbi:hypothetical protein WSK_1810 [Novosphingobium sp. Rr 2-17]|uniref:DUF3240 domain-containing protein n=1 Tax=Novosphingobium sp. Rr 2-17 TaxID=555793 RepID=UPI000269AB2D|nr:DUF3240 domain-containing protein [Novosphingobium sp. Rr 2-17]EIZ79603.1 hypothetical protein WSK_1810 [Novosphingobium sp. Rr 2-17]